MKKNQKGFTLVELIVVMVLMGIVMAGVLAIVSPTSRIASRIKSQNDEESIAIYVARYMSRELTYATKVKIVGANASDPVPAASSEFTSVYVIDNVTTRGSSAKGCKGVVRRGQWNGSTVINDFAVGQEALYAEEEFDITLSEYSTYVGQSFMTLDFAGYSMKAGSGVYERDTDRKYNYRESVEFININSQNSLYKPEGADQFSIEIDPNVATKKDKLYIFFVPALDTVFVSGAYGSASYSAAPTSTSVVNPSSVNPTATSTPTPTPSGPAKKFTVKFNNNGLSQSVPNVPEGTAIMSVLPSNPELSRYTVTEEMDKYFSQGWYYGPNGTGGMVGTLDEANTSLGVCTVYNYWVKGVQVEFEDFNGNVYTSYYVPQGGSASLTIDLPTPTEADKEFDKFVNKANNEALGGILNGTKVTYKPVAKDKAIEGADSADIRVTYVFPYNGKIYVNTNEQFTWNSTSQAATWYDKDWDLNRAAGSTDTFTVKKGTIIKVGGDSAKLTVSEADYGKTIDYYYYYDASGNVVLQKSSYTINSLALNLHFIDSPSSMLIEPRSSGAHSYYIEQGGSAYDITNVVSMWNNDCVGTKSVEIYCSTTFMVPSKSSSYTVNVSGSTHDLYIYKDIWGDWHIDKTEPPKITKLTIGFLEAPADNKILAKCATAEGQIFYDNNVNSSNSNMPFAENACGAGSSHLFKMDDDATFTIDGLEYVVPNTGESYKVWYYKKFYNDKAEAEAAYAADHNGASSFTGLIEVHWSSQTYKPNDWGEVTTGWKCNLVGETRADGNSNNAWMGNDVNKTLNMSAGETLNIYIATNWSGQFGTSTFTYEQLEADSVTDIWIMKDQITTTKPDDWVD